VAMVLISFQHFEQVLQLVTEHPSRSETMKFPPEIGARRGTEKVPFDGIIESTGQYRQVDKVDALLYVAQFVIDYKKLFEPAAVKGIIYSIWEACINAEYAITHDQNGNQMHDPRYRTCAAAAKALTLIADEYVIYGKHGKEIAQTAIMGLIDLGMKNQKTIERDKDTNFLASYCSRMIGFFYLHDVVTLMLSPNTSKLTVAAFSKKKAFEQPNKIFERRQNGNLSFIDMANASATAYARTKEKLELEGIEPSVLDRPTNISLLNIDPLLHVLVNGLKTSKKLSVDFATDTIYGLIEHKNFRGREAEIINMVDELIELETERDETKGTIVQNNGVILLTELDEYLDRHQRPSPQNTQQLAGHDYK
jgi:hypothetical protein